MKMLGERCARLSIAAVLILFCLSLTGCASRVDKARNLVPKEVAHDLIIPEPFNIPDYWTVENLGYPAAVVNLLETVAKKGFREHALTWCGDAERCLEELYAWDIDDEGIILAHYPVEWMRVAVYEP